MAPIPENRKLPKKEGDLSRSILRLYERKDYKKALKAADAVLKKFPQHGETLAMKGLVLNAMEKKEEALDHVRRGLKADLRSHVCWHVYGLLHRSDRNYPEAVKCYLNALKDDPENLLILKDLAALQIQIRDVKGLVETRRKSLGVKANLQQNWTAYAVANHVAGNAERTVQAIDTFISTLKDQRHDRIDEKYQHSELRLYKNSVLSDAGKSQEALDDLEECRPLVVDKLGWTTAKGSLLLALGRHEEAESVYRELLDRGEENYTFHRGLQCAILKLSPRECTEALVLGACALPSGALRANGKLGMERRNAITDCYRGLREKYPKSSAVEHIMLTFLQGDDLRSALDEYIRRRLHKGVPSLGNDLSSILKAETCPPGQSWASEEGGLGRPAPVVTDALDLQSHEVLRMLMSITNRLTESLRATGKFPSNSSGVNGSDSEGEEEPEETLAWALFLRSHLEEKTGALQKALDTLNECSRLQPKIVDFMQRRGRVLKKMGAYRKAAEAVNGARELDPADRYLNSKATKYFLRNGEISRAETTISIFTKHEGDPQYNLFEMQCSWFELEWAEAQIRAGKPGLAMKKALAVHSHFEDFVEDQFEFHSYCMRKVTLRSYVGMLRMADRLRSHQSYRRASSILIKAYLKLHNERPSGDSPTAEGLPDMKEMTTAEKKKLKAKARRDTKRKSAQQEAEKQKILEDEAEAARQSALDKETMNGSTNTGKKGAGTNKRRVRTSIPPVDKDPLGLTLLAKDPLSEAARLVALLCDHAGRFVETHLLAFDTAMCRAKYLMAARAVIRGLALEPNNPELLLRVIRLYHHVAHVSTACTRTEGSNNNATGDCPEETSSTSNVASLAPPSPIAARVLAEESEGLLGTDGIIGAISALIALAKDPRKGSLIARVCAAKAIALVYGSVHGKHTINEAVDLIREGLEGRGVTVETCAVAMDAMNMITVRDTGLEMVKEFRMSCAERFPMAEAFCAVAEDAQ